MHVAPYKGGGLAFDKPDNLTVKEVTIGQAIILRLRDPAYLMEVNIMTGPVLDIARVATPTKIMIYSPKGQTKPAESEVHLMAGLLLGALEADATIDGGISDKIVIEGKTAKKLEYVQSTYLSGQKKNVLQSVTVIFSGVGERVAVLAYRGNMNCQKELLAWDKQIRESLGFD